MKDLRVRATYSSSSSLYTGTLMEGRGIFALPNMVSSSSSRDVETAEVPMTIPFGLVGGAVFFFREGT